MSDLNMHVCSFHGEKKKVNMYLILHLIVFHVHFNLHSMVIAMFQVFNPLTIFFFENCLNSVALNDLCEVI